MGPPQDGAVETQRWDHPRTASRMLFMILFGQASCRICPKIIQSPTDAMLIRNPDPDALTRECTQGSGSRAGQKTNLVGPLGPPFLAPILRVLINFCMLSISKGKPLETSKGWCQRKEFSFSIFSRTSSHPEKKIPRLPFFGLYKHVIVYIYIELVFSHQHY
jgi:hypothetical protein